MTVRSKVFLTALAAVEISTLAAISLLASFREPDITGAAAILAFIAASLTGAVVAWTLAAPLGRRVAWLAERTAATAGTRPETPAGGQTEDDLSTIARAFDVLTQDAPVRLANLEADRARLAAILGGMIEGVLVVNEHGRLQLANDAARRMLRMDDAVEGRHYPEIVRQPAVASQIAAVLSGGTSDSVELSGLRDPSVTLIARTAAVVAPRGRGAVVVLHDISDLRRADQIRRDFVANVSHELRTPLTAIRGYVEALGDATPEESRRFLDVVSRHTQRMEHMVRDLLRLARLDARQESLALIECSVASLVQNVETDLAALLTSRRQTLEYDIAADASSLAADPSKMQDVLRNLIENAAHYSPEGGRIVIRARRHDARVTLAVEDQGPGIPTADLTRIFERFYRVDKSRTRDAGGTGLGLAIVKHLVELHGGRVWAANRPDGGAVFTIEMPPGQR